MPLREVFTSARRLIAKRIERGQKEGKAQEVHAKSRATCWCRYITTGSGTEGPSLASEHSKRNYAKALDEVFTLCANRSQGISLALLMKYRAAMLEKELSASTVNVRLSAVRQLVGEAQRNGIIDAEEAANLAGVPNLPQKGTRLGNWLTRDQAKELLTVPERSTRKGKRDYVILSLLTVPRAAQAGAGQPGHCEHRSRYGLSKQSRMDVVQALPCALCYLFCRHVMQVPHRRERTMLHPGPDVVFQGAQVP
ncbi:MAG: site-specific integrase [Candidatus Sulfotelmatobacter sp.]